MVKPKLETSPKQSARLRKKREAKKKNPGPKLNKGQMKAIGNNMSILVSNSVAKEQIIESFNVVDQNEDVSLDGTQQNSLEDYYIYSEDEVIVEIIEATDPIGSEEESGEEEDEEALTIRGLPRVNRFLLEDLEYEQPSVDAQITLQWPPPPPADVPESSAPIPGSQTSIPVSPAPPLSPKEHFSLSELLEPIDKFCFNWEPFPQVQIQPELRRETFLPLNKCGPTNAFSTPYEAFTAIWSPEIMEVIVTETNRYAQQVTHGMVENGSLRPQSRITHWKDTDADELFVYFSVIMATGIVVKSNIAEYWSKSMDYFSTPGFSAAMSYDRFFLLGKCLHFSNNVDCDLTSLSRSQAKLFKLRPIIDHLNNKFSTLYTMSQNIALDESLTQWKGWLDINQLIKDKAVGVGIKTYEVCESTTGYLWRFVVHAGHEQPHESGPVSGVVPTLVVRLLEGLEQQGYTVFTDHFYNSPALARELKSRGFDCVGTLRLNRQLVPKEVSQLTKQNMSLGQVCGCTSGDVDIVVWRDKVRVSVLSTYHGLATVDCDGKLKPSIIPDYNASMGGLDRKDQMLAMYPIERRRTKIWYKKFFRSLMNVSILNAYIILKHSEPSLSHRVFRTTLCNQLLTKHKASTIERPTVIAIGHFPAAYDLELNANRRRRRRCAHCKKRTYAYCPSCSVSLCLYTCFEPYHQKRIKPD